MKAIGLIGDFSRDSALLYQRHLNAVVQQHLGADRTARLLLHGVDLRRLDRLERNADWHEAGRLLADSAAALERSGADFIVLCGATMHRVIGAVDQAIRIPVVHIADATVDAALDAGVRRIGLLGSRCVLQQGFFRDRLWRAGIGTRLPPADFIARIDALLGDELRGRRATPATRSLLARIIRDFADDGAEAVVVADPAITAALRGDAVALPLFDACVLHARAAGEVAVVDERIDRSWSLPDLLPSVRGTNEDGIDLFTAECA